MVLYYNTMMRGGAVVARQAHNLKAVGSIPAPATNSYSASHSTGFFRAVNPLVSEGFTNLPNSLNISLDSVASAKESLILYLAGDRKEYSFC